MVLVAEPCEVRERRDVTVHAEHAVSHDEALPVSRVLLKEFLKRLRVSVRIDHHLRPRDPAAVDDARVVQRVAEDDVVL